MFSRLVVVGSMNLSPRTSFIFKSYNFTFGIPYWSLRVSPIFSAVRPFQANFSIIASTSDFEYFSHAVAEVATKRKCLHINPLEVNENEEASIRFRDELTNGF